MSDNTGPNPLSQAKAQPNTLSANPAEATPKTASPTAAPAQTAEAAPVAPQKKKTGLIIGAIIGVLVLAGAVVAAVLLLNMNKGDAVVRALSKMMSSNAPEYVTVDGTITAELDGQSSPVTGLEIKLKSDASTKSMINASNIDLTLKMKEGDGISLNIDEIYSTDGDLYFKINGVRDAIQSYIDMMVGNTGVDTSAYISMFESTIDKLEDKWLRISVDELKQLAGGMSGAEQLTCLTDLSKQIRSNNNTLNELFNKYPFISSTTENVTLASKGNTVYKVVLDQEKYKAFGEELKDSDFAKELVECLGEKNVTFSDGSEDLSKIPDIFVEVDGSDNFTRFYVQTEIKDTSGTDYSNLYDEKDYDTDDEELDDTLDVEEEDIIETTSKLGTVTFDLGFTYPNTINVAEPTEYDNFSTVMQSLSSPAYTTPYDL